MSDWLRRYRPVVCPWLRLVCFPHSGAGAIVFRAWAGYLPDDIELLAVAYPGRHDRITEPAVEDMAHLADSVAAELDGAEPLALFGHSIGSLVAYEVAVRLADAGHPPVRLFVSAHTAPNRIGGTAPATDAELVVMVRRLGGVTPDLLDDSELRELVLEPVRADYRLLGGYRPTTTRLPAPIVAYVGANDPLISAADLHGWAAFTTTATVTVRTFPGDHFYLVQRAPELLADIAAHLRDVAAPEGLPR